MSHYSVLHTNLTASAAEALLEKLTEDEENTPCIHSKHRLMGESGLWEIRTQHRPDDSAVAADEAMGTFCEVHDLIDEGRDDEDDHKAIELIAATLHWLDHIGEGTTTPEMILAAAQKRYEMQGGYKA